MAVVIFNQRVKHQTHDLIPTVAYEMEDGVAAYFVAAGWADEAPGVTPVMTYGPDEISFDPGTRFASGPNSGQLVVQDGVLG